MTWLHRLYRALKHLPCRSRQIDTRIVRKDGEIYSACQCGWRSTGWDVPVKALDYQTPRAVRIEGRVTNIRSRGRKRA